MGQSYRHLALSSLALGCGPADLGLLLVLALPLHVGLTLAVLPLDRASVRGGPLGHLEHPRPPVELLPVAALVLGEVLDVHPLLVHIPLVVVALLEG